MWKISLNNTSYDNCNNSNNKTVTKLHNLYIWLIVGSKPLTEQILANHQWSLLTFTWGQFHKKSIFDVSLKIPNLRLQPNLPEANELTLTTLKLQWLRVVLPAIWSENNLEYISSCPAYQPLFWLAWPPSMWSIVLWLWRMRNVGWWIPAWLWKKINGQIKILAMGYYNMINSVI